MDNSFGETIEWRMQMNSQEMFSIKRPYGPIFVLLHIIIFLLLLFNFVRFGMHQSFLTSIITLIALISEPIFITLLIYRMQLKPKAIQFKRDSLVVYNIDIPNSQIETIMIQGYFFQTIGIKPYNKKLVPSYFCIFSILLFSWM